MSMAGAVRLTVSGEVPVRRFEPELNTKLEEPLICPECRAREELALTAAGQDAHIQCPNYHQWTDPQVTAATVRQMLHMMNAGRPVMFPGRHITESLVPLLDEDRALSPPPEEEEDDEATEGFTDRERWLFGGLVDGWPLFAHCLNYSRKLAIHALPADGDLFERLYPGAGGNAVDAHMCIVVTALAMYEAAYQARTTRLKPIPLASVKAALLAADLRAIRPPSERPDYSSHLRVTDVARLEHAGHDEWERWRQAAIDILDYHVADQQVRRRASPMAGEVTVYECCDWVDVLEDDMTWYLTPGPAN
ncbi:hypothetical protein [Streptomyces noursei]|uniref:hypothetical protein n=1 Tax=Streptomyces noursei TaxID=1971 RepID=UPI00167A6470|nr:hypothetical protein [Streptomyces noursei]MCZ1015649.1 hypothetical protein [Streptomyces noursei]GGW89740.1 hypothetical protein GCM10010341_08260 [Streptomyces noursei]